MNLMYKLEKKFGRYAIPGLYKYFVFLYFAGFLINTFRPEAMFYFMFDMGSILQGQVWRVVSWLLVCMGSFTSSPFSLLFMFCLIPMGRNLEMFLGSFRMNMYLFGGMLWHVLGGAIIYFVFHLPIMLTPYYILLSMFMALAICVPDATVNLYFILPIKMKWMFLVYLLGLLYDLYNYYSSGGWFLILILGAPIIFSLLNLFVFFWLAQVRPNFKQRKRQRQFREKMSRPVMPPNMARHKCAVCGKTEKDDPNLTFRFCSKCTGNKEYCQEHLFTHVHE